MNRELKVKYILVFVIGLIFGLALHSNTSELQKCPACKSEIVYQDRVIDNSDLWKQLKIVDDTVIGFGADGLNLCSQGFYAVANGDIYEIQRVTNEMNALKPQMSNAVDKRLQVLGELGY